MTDGKDLFKKDREKILIFIFMVVVTIMLPGCPLGGENVKKLSDMTPHERGAWMLSMYNAQYADYQEQVKKGLLTETQKSILRSKKDILTQVYPLIKMYISYVDTGRMPTDEMENNVTELLNKLLAM